MTSNASALDDDQCPHWVMYQLPPFYTLQPVPATLQRQLSMWASVIFDHAAFHAARAKPPGESWAVRLYTSSSAVFTSAKLHRELPTEAVQQLFEFMSEKFPSRCALTSEGSALGLLVSCGQGGLQAVESEFYRWILEESTSATTAADLAKGGAVLTFDELVEGGCLTGSSSGKAALCADPREAQRAAAHMPVEQREQSSGAVSVETALRVLLQHLCDRGVNEATGASAFRIRLFNLDGSSDPPFDGVKVGG